MAHFFRDTILRLTRRHADVKTVDKDSRTPLHDAARAGSHDTVRRLILEGADVEAVDKDGRTPLHDAARAGSDNTVHWLISKGADVKAVDKDGRTPLHDAAQAGSDNTVHRLIGEGANVKAVDKDGRTPLQEASRAGFNDTVCRLIGKGANVNAVDKDGRTSLHDAARAGSHNTVRWLILKGADVRAVDKDGRTPLHNAARAGSHNTVRWLIGKGADIKAVDKDGRTPLHDAARAGSDDTAHWLIFRGANEAVDKDGRTSFHNAARAGSHNTRWLIGKGANVEAVDKDSRNPYHNTTRAGSDNTVHRLIGEGADIKAVDKNGRTPLHDAARAGSEDTVHWLISEGADVKAVDKDSRTPLHDAAQAGSDDTVHWLIFKGADVEAVDKDGRTPLHDAARAGSDGTVHWLIFKGANVEAVDKGGRTPLHDAARAGSEGTVRCLILDAADVEAVDKDGRTPLHDAARAGSHNTVRWLIGKGADIKAVDKDGRTPLHDAAQAGSDNTVHWLISKGADVKAVDKDGRTPLHDAAQAGSDNTVHRLIGDGANVEAVDKNGRTPLHNAARAGSEGTVRWLILKGADVRAVDKDSRTPLHDAARAGSDNTVHWLISKGADVKAVDKDGRTPLHDAAQAGSDNTVHRLILDAADVEAVDKDGRTPLHDAARAGSHNTVRWLILRGAEVKAVDKDGCTPLHDATRAGSDDTVRWLILEGADVEAVDKDGRTPLHGSVPDGSDRMLCFLFHVTRKGLLARTEPKAVRLSDIPNLEVATSPQMPSGVSSSAVLQHWHLNWGGLETYEACDGSVGDVLTISTRRPGTHAYIAKSMSEYLSEFHPSFGLSMLEWIARICKGALQDQKTSPTIAHLGLQSIQFQVTPGDYSSNTSAFKIAQSYTGHSGLITLSGVLKAGLLTITLSTNTTTPTAEVKLVLAWILLALQPRQKDMQGLFTVSVNENTLDNGLPRIFESFSSNSESSCWRDLFSYAVVMDLPHLPHSKAIADTPAEGLEIDLDLLTELAAVDRETEIESGGLLKYGFETAIVPLEPAENRRWHYFATQGRQITPMRAEQLLRLHGLGTRFKLASRYQKGKVYVGWCPNPIANPFPAIEVSTDSGVSVVKTLEEHVERNSAKDLSILARIGFLGTALGIAGSIKRDKKYKQVCVIAKRTLERNFEGILTTARVTPCILWDHSQKTAWLLPAISALAFASLRYVEWKDYLFKIENEAGNCVKVNVSLVLPKTSLAHAAEDFLRKNALLLVDTVRGIKTGERISFEQIARRIWEGMTVGEDVCSSDITGQIREKDGALFGYDLKEAVCSDRVQLRKLQSSDGIRSWAPLCQVKRVQVIFCNTVGNVLTCRCNWPLGLEQHETKFGQGRLHSLLEELKVFYGENWPSCVSNTRGLQIGEEYEWIPIRHHQNGCNSLPLQSVTRKQIKLKKNDVDGDSQSDNAGSLPSRPVLLTFG